MGSNPTVGFEFLTGCGFELHMHIYCMCKEIIEKMLDAGASQRAIALQLNIGQTSVRYWIKKYGLKKAKLDIPSKTCKHCKSELTKSKKGRVNEYCNNKCHKDFQWAECKQRIEAQGTASSVRTAKRYLIEKNRKCSICSNSTWLNFPIPLILDHIDGNADNWKLTNLRLVCGNCDMMLPTYKSKNRGNGRAWRRQRYAEGKSY